MRHATRRPAPRRRHRDRPALRHALAALLCLVTLGAPPRDETVPRGPAPVASRNLPSETAAAPSSGAYAALFDPRPTLGGSSPEPLAQGGLGSSFRPAVPPAARPATTLAALAPAAAPAAEAMRGPRIVPLPVPRAADLLAQALPRSAERRVRRTQVAALPAPAAETPSFFEELFSGRKETGPALAYAAPETLDRSRGRLVPSPEAGTAIYDITARTVRLPSGEVLEAHSGLGPHMDNPDSVHLRMRGSTPPGTYDLVEREALFHGVRAIRLNPVGGSAAIHGRDGILAHTYMLGPSGASNGCVSFRNYDRFLQAYLRGEIRRLVVVTGRWYDRPAHVAVR